ncbi:erythromycin esterase family protein [Gramella sp. GC03-9]|uniref:Erythromycin esterase family protein n=1 Tax=Christiangramia oceanisediminis TaxID=2920386 RepID=A0A9X2RCX5_9FLAO|nr:erythromycin esterase family protein [Gramella oceanisediminis]MCP9201040.1 erythromycin esterase family protein [Gramella oceanisediminis]
MSFSDQEKDISKYIHKLGNSHDLEPLMERIGDSRFVLLGEASHGTHEYYTWRAEISKRLIKEKGFDFIAVEGDWPDCFNINKWIKNGDEQEIQSVLEEFKRWPTWMWANWEIAAFANWLKSHNQERPASEMVGFYGLDVYSLWESMELIVSYLENEDPETAEIAKNAMMCFQPYKERDSYGSIFNKAKPGCQDQVIELLKKVRQRSHNYDHALEADLNAEMNALVMANAERYYKAMSDFTQNSWNVRDRHMMETLDKLLDYHGDDSKVIVWAHNTHIGDARATDMANHGLFNLGELVRREKGTRNTVLVGFGSYAGSVIAGKSWGAPMQEMELPEAIPGSFEHKLHNMDSHNKLMIFDEHPRITEAFEDKIGHRAVGVVYDPDNERSNYVPSEIPERYDAFIYLDQTQGLHPLKYKPEGKLTPETFPFGI